MREKLRQNHLLDTSSHFAFNFWFKKRFNENKKSNEKKLLKLLFLFFLFFITFTSNVLAYKKGFYQDGNQNNDFGDLQITVYPHELTVREGKEAVFECRARTFDNSNYPQVRWTRVDAPLPENVHESSGGRLTFQTTQLSHAGRYACIAVHNRRTVEAQAILHVKSYGPQEFQSSLQDGLLAGCMADEKACANKQCVKADYVCDGERDCADGSDEINCPTKRHCEPNEFKCDNNRCVQKMWLCDGDDDCGDNSDERNCGQRKPGDICQPTEFRCSDGQQCVPQSFQCDGTNDCKDGSDEIGCVQPTIVNPPDSNKVVPVGSDFKLTCRAVAVPDPYINWRLNWGQVCEPPRCQQQSKGGVGTLTIQNAQPLDQGAYTCEAINVKGRVLATPDCIVRIVNISAPSPPAPPPQRPLTCHPPQTPQVPHPPQIEQPTNPLTCSPAPQPQPQTCGNGLFNERSPQGCLNCFCFGVTNQCQSSNLFRTKEKIFFLGDSQGVSLATSNGVEQVPENSGAFNFEHYGFLTHKEANSEIQYWKLPQQFLGDKVTSYGGQLSIQLQYKGSGHIKREPFVILKGNGISIVHRPRNQEHIFVVDRPLNIQIPTYEHSYEHLTGGPVSREDLLTVLADLDLFLIRSTHTDDQQSSSLGEVSWEYAVDKDTQDTRALEVEHCVCPPGYVGTSCEDCAPGYERSDQGPYLGTCVPKRAPPALQCSAAGAVSTQPLFNSQCHCKQNTIGTLCNRCAPGSFHLAPQNSQGCLKCFCSSVTNQCQSSGLNRATIELDYSRGALDQLELTSHDVRNPFIPTTRAQVFGGAINFNGLHESRDQTLYWKLPSQFLGDKVSSYGGKLKYTYRVSNENSVRSSEPDVIIRGNDITLHYTHTNSELISGNAQVEIPIYEDKWHRSDGQPATREHLLMTLADLSDILIKAGSSSSDSATTSLVRVSLDHAVSSYESPNGERAFEVEECECPIGYVGTSCEDCAPGYSRTGGGLYLGLCQKCNCNGHALECDSEYGACINCQHNTEGDQCERCRPGFVGDATRGTPIDCQRAPEENLARPPCQCYNHSPRGCDSLGRCLLCEHNTEGFHCETCKKGFYGDATHATPYDCTSCPCPSASDCFLDQSGHVQCRNCPAGFAGRLCDECAPGYTRSQTSGGRDCEPIGHVYSDHIDFVPKHQVPLRVEILPPKHLSITEGNRAKWFCKSSESFKPDDVQIEWAKIGYEELPANVRVHGNQLLIESAQFEDAGQYRCTGRTKDEIATDDANLIVVSHQPKSPPRLPVAEQTQTPKPIVTPPHQTVDENQQAVFTCLTPGFADCEVEWHFNQIGGPLPYGVHKRGNQIFIPNVQQQHVGNYICSVYHQFGRAESNPGRLDINKTSLRPIVDPLEHNVEVNDAARFRCWVPGVPDAVLKWRPAHGSSLPTGSETRDGFLNFPRVDTSHIGQYVCSAYDIQRDPQGSNPVDSELVRLSVRQPAEFYETLQPPSVDPLHLDVNVGEPARFRCWVPNNPQARLRWSTQSNQPLPIGSTEQDGVLTFSSTEEAHSGAYVCSAYNPQSGQQVPSVPVQLQVRKSQKPLVDPPEQIVHYGEPSRIRCWMPGGGKNVQLRWSLKGGLPLIHGARDDGRGNLVIHRTLNEHEKEYECISYDPSSSRQTSDPAIVKLHPAKPQVDPPHQTVNRGDPSQIRCWVPNSSPNIVLSWSQRGNFPLPNKAHDDGHGILNIPQTDTEHEAEYECTARDQQNPLNPPQISDPATIRLNPVTITNINEIPLHESKEIGLPPQPIATPSVLTVKRGEPARFHCDPRSPHSRAEIHWGFNSDNGLLRDDTAQHDNDILIPASNEEDAGEYICTAINAYGTGRADPVQLIITNNEEPPTAIVVPKIWNGKPGERHQFKCHVTGIPTPTISWRGPSKISAHRLPDDVVDLGDGVLEITNARKNHEGDYTCQAINSVGEASDFGTISIGSSLIVKTDPPGPRIILTVGEPLEIKCEAFGDPEPNVEWLHDPGPERGDLPDDYVPITISEQFLRHPKIGLGNSGRYTCKGSNKFASVTKDIYIEVVEPSQLATVAVLGGSNQWFPIGQPAQLVCASSGSSLVERIEWTRDGSTSNLPAEVSDESKPGILHFETFKQSHVGEYECKAYRKEEIIATTKVKIYSDINMQPDVVHVEISPPTVRVVNKGDSIILDCNVHGLINKIRPIAYTWLFGYSITKMAPIAWCFHRILHIQNVFAEHAGLYIVRTRLINGLYKTSLPIYLIVRGTTTIRGHSPDEFSYVWSLARGGSLIRQLGKETQLTIKDADPSNDYGIYRCEVENDNGDSVGGAKVAVAVGFDSSTNPQEAKFDDGSEAVLTCPVFLVPGAIVSWSKQEDDLPSNAKQKSNALVINNFDDSASGIYTCSVQYGQNSIEGYVNAKIFVPDTTIKVVLNASADSVQVGERAWLDCIVVGDATAKIEFSKENSDVLPDNAQVTGNRLLFTSISEENSGKYVCKAITFEGPLETSALLNVESAKRKRKHLPESLNYKYINDNENNHEPKIHKTTLSKHHNSKISYKNNYKDEHKNAYKRLNKKRLHYVLVNGTQLLQKPRQSLRGQELRRQREKFAEARRQRHRILRENLKRQKEIKAKELLKNDELYYINHHKAIVSKNNNEKNQKMNYHYYETNTGNDKPEKMSIFGKWFASN